MANNMQQYDLFVTCVDKIGPLLKIWGQIDRKTSIYIEQVLLDMLKQIEKQKIKPVTVNNLQIGLLCCAKYKDGIYYRAQIRNIRTPIAGTVEVRFIDYGNIELIELSNIRLYDEFSSRLNDIPPQASEFVLAGIAHVNNTWDDQSITFVHHEIAYTELKTISLCSLNNFKLVKIIFNETDLSNFLIKRGICVPIPLNTQDMILNSISGEIKKPQAPQNGSLSAYKPTLLPVGSEHYGYIAYMEDGPFLFSVQLQGMEQNMHSLMNEINSLELMPLSEPPVPGYPCLARCLEDNSICRSVVLNLVGDKCKTYYVDFGNSELLPFTNIYQIPSNYILPKAMSMRFALAGLKNINVTEEVRCSFQNFVSNRRLRLKVVKGESPLIQYCELYDENNRNILEVLSNAPSDYKSLTMNKGAKHNVIVSFIHGCKKFFVQLKECSESLNSLMLALAATSEKTPNLNQNEITSNICCCAFYPNDNQWYRAKIISVHENTVLVKYVDYGNEETINKNQLKRIDPQFIDILPSQAIECCLYGYQNMSFNSEIENVFESLTLECEFTMKVMNKHSNNVLLVDLFDTAGNNVAALLIEKLAAQKSQIGSLPSQQVTNQIINEANSNSYSQIAPKLHSPKRDERFSPKERSPKNDSFSPKDKMSWRSPENKGSWRAENSEERKPWRNTEDNRNWRSNMSPKEEKPLIKYQNTPKISIENNRKITQKKKREKSQDVGGGGDAWDNRPPRPRTERQFSQDNMRPKSKNDSWSDDLSTSSSKKSLDNKFNKPKREWNDENKSRPQRSAGEKVSKSWIDSKPPKKDWKDNKKSDDSSSDKSFKRNDFNKPEPKKEFPKKERTRKSDTDTDTSEKSWKGDKKGKSFSPKKDYNSPKKEQKTVPQPLADLMEQYKLSEIPIGSNQNVGISWFYSPENFFCQILSNHQQFRDMMIEIQSAYIHPEKKSINGTIPIGASVIAEFTEDSILYRATVLDFKPPKYKVQYVDFGNIALVDSSKIFQIEQRFMELPVQCVRCSIGSIKPLDENWVVCEEIDKIFNKDNFVGLFEGISEDKYNIQLWDGELCVKNQLIEAELAKDSSCFEMDGHPTDLNMLTGQTIKIRLSCIYTLEKFYVQANKSKAEEIEKAVFNYIQNTKNLQPIISEAIVPDVNCLVKIEEKWYRGIIVDVSNVQSIEVKCPDTGEKFAVSSESLYPLPTELCIFWYQAFECGLHNFTNDSCRLLSDEQFKEEYENKDAILYVDGIDGGRPVVTIYDLNGNKISLFEPDENAYPTVEKVCPLPVLNHIITCYVTHIDNVNSIYIQQKSDANIIANLLENMYTFYESQGTNLEAYNQYQLCAAKSVDGNWYRAKILEVMDNEIKVNYIDYGNEENINKELIKVLDEQFYDINELALCVSLNLIQNSEECKEKLLGLTTDKDLKISLIFGEHNWIAEIWDGDTSINKTLVDLNLASYPQIEPYLAVCPAKPADFDESRAAVTITHIDSPSEFYVQLVANENEINMLQHDLKEKIDSLSNLEGAEVGSLCAAKYHIDDNWYRAEVLDSDSDITTVRFVDFGNTDVINNKCNLLKTLPSELLAVDKYARKCALNVISTKEEWTQEACAIFERAINTDILYADIVYQDEKNKTYVELYASEKNIAELLIQANHAERITRDLEDNIANNTCFVSHLNSISEFWIQLESSVPDLEMIVERMLAIDTFPDLTDLSPGILCAALFPDDDQWYRARILSNTVAGVEVLFIDYGNSSTALKLKVLPEELIHMPPLAQKCSLNKPSSISQWTEEAIAKFQEISEEGATIFTIKKLATGETAIVELYVAENNIVDQLVPLCDGRPTPIGEPNYIKSKINHIDTLSEIYITRTADLGKLDEIMDKISNSEQFEDLNEKSIDTHCLAYNEIDQTWYRAKILSENTVQLIDYGNKIEITKLKTLPNDVANISAVAIQCETELPPNINCETALQELIKINSNPNQEYNVEFLNNLTPRKIKISLNGKDVFDEISNENVVASKDETIDEEKVNNEDISSHETILEQNTFEITNENVATKDNSVDEEIIKNEDILEENTFVKEVETKDTSSNVSNVEETSSLIKDDKVESANSSSNTINIEETSSLVKEDELKAEESNLETTPSNVIEESQSSPNNQVSSKEDTSPSEQSESVLHEEISPNGSKSLEDISLKKSVEEAVQQNCNGESVATETDKGEK